MIYKTSFAKKIKTQNQHSTDFIRHKKTLRFGGFFYILFFLILFLNFYTNSNTTISFSSI